MTKCNCSEEPFNPCDCYKPAHPKPGLSRKSSKIKNKSKIRIHDIEKPKDTYCRFCGQPDDESCYWHHCEIPYLKLKYGSGTARKVNDNLTVFAHHTCGVEMSKKPVLGEEFFNGLMRFNGVVDSLFINEWENKWLLGIIESRLV